MVKRINFEMLCRKKKLGITVADVVTLWQYGLAICKVCSASPKNDHVTLGNCSFNLLPPKFSKIENIRL